MDIGIKKLSMDLHKTVEDTTPPPQKDSDFTNTLLTSPIWVKSIVLFLIINPTFAIYFCYDAIGAVSPYLTSNNIITTEQVSFLYTVYAIMPPVLALVSGIMIDKFGTRPVAIMTLIPMILGNALVMIGLDYHFYWLVLIGRILMGTGEAVYVVVLAVLSIMFEGKWLVVGSAIAVAWGNVGAGVVFLILPALLPYGLSPTLSITVVIPSIILITTLTFFLLDIYYFGNRTRNKIKSDSMKLSDIKKLSRAYWMVVFPNSLQMACVIVGVSFGSLVLTDTMGYSVAKAGYVISFTNLMTLFAPLTGWLLERYGYKCETWQASSLLLLLSFTMIGFNGFQIGPLWFILVGVSLSFLGGPLMAAIPTVVNDESITGTAYGISVLLLEVGLLTFPEAIGVVKSRSGGWYGYWFLAAISFLSLLCLFYLKVLDKRHGIFVLKTVEPPHKPEDEKDVEGLGKNETMVEEDDHEKSSLVELSEDSSSSNEEVLTNLGMVAQETENTSEESSPSSE